MGRVHGWSGGPKAPRFGWARGRRLVTVGVVRLTIDRSAVITGAVTTALFAVPLALGAGWAASRGASGVALWCNLGVLAAFVVGSGCAAWVQTTGYPLAHALITSIATFLALTGIGVIVAIARGQSPHWFRQLFLLTATMAMGVLGGMIGARLKASGIEPGQRRRPPAD